MPEQDWFAANAPKSSGDDWFAANAPKAAAISSAAEEPGFLDKEIPLSSYKNATLQGLQTVGRGVRSAVQGVGQMIAHPIESAKGIAALPGQALQVPAAISDINASADPLGTYAKVAQETAGQGAGQAALALGTEGLIRGGGALARKVLGPAATSVAERLYQSTLKPSLAKNAPNPAQLVRTGLENEIPVSQAGVEKLSNLITDLNDKIADTISSDPTKTVSRNAVASRLGDTVKKFSTQVNPKADLQAINESGQEFMSTQPAQIPAEQAQALKVGTYRQLKGKAYGELKSATVESQKALARGLKEELVNQFPELKALNAQDSKLINLDGALEHAVRRIDNHQLIGLGAPVAAAGMGVATGSGVIGVISGVMKTVLDNPIVKSKLAISLNKAATASGRMPMATAMSRVGLYSSALANAANAQPPADPANSQ